ncbi:hypothetical protein [Streptomyces sp. NPDC021622]|uniref:hypothetical protein n=1 Tax=Streptomyces sp. NPDC021622 TaxID=3155013 RepID=UPI0033E3D0B7
MDEPPLDDDLGQFGGFLTFPRAKQDYYLGGTYTLLGQHQQARHHAATAIEAYRMGRRRSVRTATKPWPSWT